jgi:hypothetical protein
MPAGHYSIAELEAIVAALRARRAHGRGERAVRPGPVLQRPAPRRAVPDNGGAGRPAGRLAPPDRRQDRIPRRAGPRAAGRAAGTPDRRAGARSAPRAGRGRPRATGARRPAADGTGAPRGPPERPVPPVPTARA